MTLKTGAREIREKYGKGPEKTSEGAWNENGDNLHFESCLQLLVINPQVLSAVNLVSCWELPCDLLPQARDIQVLILSKCLPVGTQFGVGSQELRSVPSRESPPSAFFQNTVGKGWADGGR